MFYGVIDNVIVVEVMWLEDWIGGDVVEFWLFVVCVSGIEVSEDLEFFFVCIGE